MEPKNDVSWDEFLELTDSDSGTECEQCRKQDFLGWETFPPDFEDTLEVYGEFAEADTYIDRNGYEQHHPEGTNYWSDDAPVALAYYPYHQCLIRRCPDCHAVFLSYTDCSGHVPEYRMRWARKELIRLTD